MRRNSSKIDAKDLLEDLKNRKVELLIGFIRAIVGIILFTIVPILLFYLMEGFEHNAYEEVREQARLYNIYLFELIAWLLFFVTGSGRLALRIETGIALVYGLVNHYIMAFRSTPFVPWDIFSIETASSVAGNYDFTPTKEMFQVCAGFLLIFVLLHFFKFKFPYGILYRVIPTVCVCLVLSFFVNLLWDDDFQRENYLYPFLFTPAYMTKVNGMAVTFAMNLEYVYVEKPDGYSEKMAQSILKEYETKDEIENNDSQNIQDSPNIIVIMNEAFSDLSVLGDFETNVDYMPFIHSLQQGQENTITGNLMVSVCGGNTANTEFEFLTGHTMDYFPVGSIPYQQYITGQLPSVASHLADLGYTTYGMHPYNATGWNRDKVYPLLGFAHSYFVKDYEGRRYLRGYVSDKSSYEKILDIYEKKEEGEPIFVFEVTMQNHGGYTEEYEGFVSDVQTEGFSSKQLNQYLSLMKISDRELKRMVDYFSEEDEKTMIVFFGDHQPSDAVVKPILKWNGINTSNMTAEQAQLRYKVPYVIWANYDIEEEQGADTDISFLSAEMLEKANLPMTAYQNFLLELRKNPTSEKLLEQYEILQYYFMFDY